MIPRKQRQRILIGPILRLNALFAGGADDIYSASAAAYGLLHDGPWGTPGSAHMREFGDQVLEHMVSEGASLTDILEAGRVSSAELWKFIPTQREVDEALGNSQDQGTASTSP